MSRREDKIIAEAFGDGDNPRVDKGSQLFHEYSSLRQELSKLREVPDHQLSNERLRDAILAGGLHDKEAQDSTEKGWAFPAMAACGVAALVFLSFRFGRQSGTPTIIEQQPLNAVALNDKPTFNFSKILNSKASSSPKARFPRVRVPVSAPAEPGTLASLASLRPNHFRHAKHPRSQSHPLFDPSWLASAPAEAGVSGSLVAFRVSPSSPNSASETRSNTKDANVAAAGDTREIVEIGQEKDQETGARSAREVESKNVLVGG